MLAQQEVICRKASIVHCRARQRPLVDTHLSHPQGSNIWLFTSWQSLVLGSDSQGKHDLSGPRCSERPPARRQNAEEQGPGLVLTRAEGRGAKGRLSPTKDTKEPHPCPAKGVKAIEIHPFVITV